MKSIKTLTLNDGKKIELILTFEALYRLKSTFEEEYEIFCKLIFEGLHNDLINYIRILHICYLMANQESLEEKSILSFEEFLKKVNGIDPLYLVNLAVSLTSSKKNNHLK